MTDRAYLNEQRTRCRYPCQKLGEDGQRIQRECGVSIDPRFNGKWWKAEGPPDAPTLSPSIDCLDKPCWHGFIVNGEVRA